MEWKLEFESFDKEHSHSWVRISHGLKKLVTDLSNKEHDDNEQEASEIQFEDCALKSNVLAFASRSNAKAKPQGRISASSSTKTVPIGERTWTDVETQDYSPIDDPVLKQLITLLRHGHQPREEDGAIEFWRLQDYLRNHFVQSQHWSDEMGKSTMAKGGGNKKSFQYCTDPSRQEVLYLRTLQSHSGRNLIESSLPGHCVNSGQFLLVHLSCRMCNQFTFHHQFRIDTGGQILSKRQTVFFTSVDPVHREQRDPETVDLKPPRLARYLQTAWKKHQNTVYWVDIRLAQKKALKFYQTRSNPLQYTPRLLYPEGYQDGNWRYHIRERYMRHPGRLRRFPLKTIG